MRSAWVVLLVEGTILGLLGEIRGEIMAGEDALEIVGKQNALGADTAGWHRLRMETQPQLTPLITAENLAHGVIITALRTRYGLPHLAEANNATHCAYANLRVPQSDNRSNWYHCLGDSGANVTVESMLGQSLDDWAYREKKP